MHLLFRYISWIPKELHVEAWRSRVRSDSLPDAAERTWDTPGWYCNNQPHPGNELSRACRLDTFPTTSSVPTVVVISIYRNSLVRWGDPV